MTKKLHELKNERAELLKSAETLLNEGKIEEHDEVMTHIKELNAEIGRKEELDIERGRFADSDKEAVNAYKMMDAKKEEAKKEQTLDGVLKEKEYARAFCNAIRNGISVRNILSDRVPEGYFPLKNALTIAGNPAGGQDGGFLVPIDVSTKISEYRRQLSSLANVVNVEEVSTIEGKRPVDTNPTKGFTKIDGELKPVPMDDQPIFSQVGYKVDDYGLVLPLSKDLVEDEDANLLSYIGRWLAKKQVLTENKIILEALDKVKSTEVNAKPFDAIKKVLNVTLDPSIAMNSRIITNQTGYNILDVEKDTTGNYLFNNSLLRGTGFQLLDNAISVLSNLHLADVSGAAPMYIGDFKAYVTLFRRKNLEIRGTDIGGDAWRNNGYEMRAITRMCASVFDKDAVAKLTVKPTPSV